jgi:hypothetical protein
MRTTSRRTPQQATTVRFVLALLVCSASTTLAHAQAGPPLEPPAVCVTPPPAATSELPGLERRNAETRFAGDAFVRTELFFGSERSGLPEVSPEEFDHFLDIAVTPCFPDGLTVLTGKGQFRESDGQIVQETSFVLVLLYPLDARKESHAKIEAIRELYKSHFLQQSVLRVDDPRAVRVGF